MRGEGEEEQHGSCIGDADAAVAVHIRAVTVIGLTEYDGQHRIDILLVDLPVAVGIAGQCWGGLREADCRAQGDEQYRINTLHTLLLEHDQRPQGGAVA